MRPSSDVVQWLSRSYTFTDRRVTDPGPLTPPPPPSVEPNARYLVEGDGLSADGWLIEANDTVLRLRVPSYPDQQEIPWTAIRRISRRQGTERKWWIPTIFALLGGGLLGSCGWLLDELNRSTSGNPSRGGLLGPTVLIGGLVGALLGTLIVFAIPGPYWDPIYAVPDGYAVAESQPVDTRLAAYPVSDEIRQAVSDRRSTSTCVAWFILGAVLLVVSGLCSRYF
jgi:hypothetical protein